MALSVGQRVTLIKIDDCMAMTHRYEFEVRGVQDPQGVGYGGHRQRVAVVRQRGKRKAVYLDLAADDILLDDGARAKIIVTRGERTTCSDDGQELLYPDIETHHAVVNRMKGA